MYSHNSENLDFDINEFLISQHPEAVLQFIVGVFAEWAERQNSEQLGKFDKVAAMKTYLSLLRHDLEARLLLLSSQKNFNKSKDLEILGVSPQTSKIKKDATISLMESMSPSKAMEFLAEVTSTWIFSIPEKFFPLIPVTLHSKSEKSIADAVYVWLTRYFDLWN